MRLMYIRKMATVLARDEQRLLQLRDLFARVVQNQDENAKSYFWPKYLEVVLEGISVNAQNRYRVDGGRVQKVASAIQSASG